MNVAAIVSCLLFVGAAGANVVDRIVAVINDQIITRSDLESFGQRLKSKGLVDEALLNFYDSKKLATNSAAQMEYLIDERLIDSEVRRQGIVTPIEKVEAEIRTILSRTQTSRDALKASLKARGINYSDYQDFIKTSLERQSLLQKEIGAKIKISDDDIAAQYIQMNRNSKALVFEYDLAHILFLPTNGGPDEALRRAQAVKAKLAQGADFEALAAQHSEDPDFSQGGVFGTVKVGDVVAQMETALRGVRPGDTTDVVKMPDGFHIFKVNRRRLVASPDFEKARGRIADSLFSESFKRQYLLWIEGLRNTSYIKINK